MDKDDMAHAATTQRLLAGVKEKLGMVADALAAQNTLATQAHEMSLLVLRAMCEVNPDLRAQAIRLAQEPALNKVSADFSQHLLKMLSDQNRSQSSRSRLKPVPSGDEPQP